MKAKNKFRSIKNNKQKLKCCLSNECIRIAKEYNDINELRSHIVKFHKLSGTYFNLCMNKNLLEPINVNEESELFPNDKTVGIIGYDGNGNLENKVNLDINELGDEYRKVAEHNSVVKYQKFGNKMAGPTLEPILKEQFKDSKFIFSFLNNVANKSSNKITKERRVLFENGQLITTPEQKESQYYNHLSQFQRFLIEIGANISITNLECMDVDFNDLIIKFIIVEKELSFAFSTIAHRLVAIRKYFKFLLENIYFIENEKKDEALYLKRRAKMETSRGFIQNQILKLNKEKEWDSNNFSLKDLLVKGELLTAQQTGNFFAFLYINLETILNHFVDIKKKGELNFIPNEILNVINGHLINFVSLSLWMIRKKPFQLGYLGELEIKVDKNNIMSKLSKDNEPPFSNFLNGDFLNEIGKNEEPKNCKTLNEAIKKKCKENMEKICDAIENGYKITIIQKVSEQKTINAMKDNGFKFELPACAGNFIAYYIYITKYLRVNYYAAILINNKGPLSPHSFTNYQKKSGKLFNDKLNITSRTGRKIFPIAAQALLSSKKINPLVKEQFQTIMARIGRT